MIKDSDSLDEIMKIAEHHTKANRHIWLTTICGGIPFL